MSLVEALHTEHRPRPRPVVMPVIVPPRSAYVQDADYELAWHNEITESEPVFPIIKVENILRAVCNHFMLERADLVSARRTGHLLLPRHIAFYLAKTLTLRSLPEIGRRMGDRDHTTVLHGARKIARLLLSDGDLQETIRTITTALGGVDMTQKRKPTRVFNADIIRAIRASPDPQHVIAERYNVSRGTISNIKRRRAWPHVA